MALSNRITLQANVTLSGHGTKLVLFEVKLEKELEVNLAGRMFGVRFTVLPSKVIALYIVYVIKTCMKMGMSCTRNSTFSFQMPNAKSV